MTVAPTLEPKLEESPVTNEGPDYPADLLRAVEEASPVPIRPEYVERLILVPPPPDRQHNKSAYELSFQLRTAGFELTGINDGFRVARGNGKTVGLLIPDFYVLHREATELDERYRAAHKGWYPIDMVALAGEVTSTNHEVDTGSKARTYATGGVSVYVVIHREEGQAYAYSDPFSDPENPAKSHYRTVTSTELGGKLQLPEPYTALDTGFLAPR
jgi:Uma2 family endonuclease